MCNCKNIEMELFVARRKRMSYKRPLKRKHVLDIIKNKYGL